MPPRLPSNRDAEQQLPFTGDNVNDADFAQDLSQAENGGHSLPASRSIRSHSITAQTLSGSYSRNPIRSFAHQTSHGFAGTRRVAITKRNYSLTTF
jgi:SulP family sulfate permease